MLNRQRLLLGVAGRLLPLAAKVPRGLQHLVLQRVANRLFAQPLEEGAFDLLEGRWLRLEVRDLASAGASPGCPAACAWSNGHGPA